MTKELGFNLLYNVQMTKELGFNMVRKHIKVESRRWYYHTDRMGLLVWQVSLLLAS